MKKEQLLSMTEGAVMIALATVLSLIKVVRFPWGGSITLLSMLPIVLFSIRRDVGSGLAASFVYAVVQLMFGVFSDGVFGWGLTPAALLGCILLDYLMPFFLLGVAGILRTHRMGGWMAGITLSLLLRLTCHVVSGVVIFASVGLVMDIHISDPWLYSLAYNAAYMVPELVFTLVAAALLLGFPSTRKMLLQKGVSPQNRI